MFLRHLRPFTVAGFVAAAPAWAACASGPVPMPVVDAPAPFSSAASVEAWVEFEGQGTVDGVADRLVAAVTEAGMNHFTTIDHGAGARAAGLELGGMKLVVFGNPKVGSRLMAADPRVGQELPLRVLVREGREGVVRIGFASPLAFAGRYELATVVDTLAAMDKALRKFAAAALSE
jgi:uncharacterized protein (DUF302 family)